MLRVFNGCWDGGDSLPELDKAEWHHLARVRRVREGEPVEVLNGRGSVGHARVVSGPGKLRLELQSVTRAASPRLRVHLLVALPKGKTFPLLLHKAVELGVSAVTPLITRNVEAGAAAADRKRERWEAVLVEALKQSGNPWLPACGQPVELARAVQSEPGPVQRLCAALQPDSRPVWQMLETQLRPEGELQVFIGPEGDFSADEYQLLRGQGCHMASLGPLVLKVETAASLLVGLLQCWAQAR
jgi:16S rRNA (uracil1498-N3)-methyltransferase